MAECEYRCFVGGLAWATNESRLEEAFKVFGNIINSQIISDRETGRSKGFGFVTFSEQTAMNNAIKAMNCQELDGHTITVNQDQPKNGGDHGSGYRGGSRGRNIRARVGGSQGDNSRAQEEGNQGAHGRGVRGYGGGGYVSDGYESRQCCSCLYNASNRRTRSSSQ